VAGDESRRVAHLRQRSRAVLQRGVVQARRSIDLSFEGQ
jgi:hypothetical protein